MKNPWKALLRAVMPPTPEQPTKRTTKRKTKRAPTHEQTGSERAGHEQSGRQPTERQHTGRAGEDRALAHLQNHGLRLLQRNFHSPGRGGGEIDLVMQTREGTVVFVEVRVRSARDYGGAAESIGATKRRRILHTARHYLQRWRGTPPPCRFDVVLIDGPDGPLQWIEGAFDEGG